jgi:hypothetical protein
MNEILKTELETYAKELPKLLDREGSYVLIKDTEVTVYESRSDALAAGSEKYKQYPFLVKLISRIEPTIFFTRRLDLCQA